jgi:hypothetical protein
MLLDEIVGLGAADGVTSKIAVIVPLANDPDAAWVAVIVVEPTPTTVIVLPETVATDVSLEVYVKAPALLLVGGVIVKAADPTDLLGIEKPLKTGAFSACFANT